MLHNSTLENSMIIYVQKWYNSQKSIKSIDTEKKCTDPLLGIKPNLT
jgi:hypothetical protein